jgi:class 3 adenylate cyclase/pimeloyl-ACP methyl ester carboxylesterase
VAEIPTTQYVRTDEGLALAYQVFGEGDRDIVLIFTVHCVDLLWEEPTVVHMMRRLARLGRVITIDYRGFGASDPVPLGALPTPEAWMEDTRVVLDAVGSSSAHIVCHGGAGFFGMLFAATYPRRTETLTLFEATARYRQADDYQIGAPSEVLDAFAQWDVDTWGTEAHVLVWAPSRAGDERFCRWVARFERGSASPAVYRAANDWVLGLDLRAVLPSIRVPTLVMHREDGLIPIEHVRYLVEHIPGARLDVVPGHDYWHFTEHADEILDHIEEFITGVVPAEVFDRALATVMFTDIVGSTEFLAQVGDRRWKELLAVHDALVEAEIERFRGRMVRSTRDSGDGALATFDGPGRAIRCACAIRDAVRSLGIDVRAGLHSGEIELRGDDVAGMAVHIGARVSALAGAGEVFVSSTVKDLVAGSGIDFEDRGEHELKGVPGSWKVYGVGE